ncbi:hypothetical protein MM698_002957 [Escherichia coli]|uniref:hypothetical protein n=1 Tax=Escherichia coli TaxID=562 RepID=UPI000B50363F|nr:hypothetical protein [Escherichia coli]EIY7828154.1 hypothetical protein [Escherichia coli]
MPDAEKVVGLIRRDQRRIRHHAQMPDAGCRMPDAGCRMPDAGCRMQRKRLIRPTKAIISTGFLNQRIKQSCSQHIDGAFVFYFVNEAPFTI